MKSRIRSCTVTIFFASSIVLAGCSLFFGEDGRDGQPGEAYIAYSWVGLPLYLSTSDPSLPQSIYNGTYYDAIPGTYSFEYQAFDGSYWQGTYTTYVNPGELGEPGFLFTDGRDGADGEDIYFELTLYSTGPTLWDWPDAYSNNRERRNQGHRELDGFGGIPSSSAQTSTALRF